MKYVEFEITPWCCTSLLLTCWKRFNLIKMDKDKSYSLAVAKCAFTTLVTFPKHIVIRYKVYVMSEQHPRAGLNTQHVLDELLARAGQNM